jgi:hypothetical protein
VADYESGVDVELVTKHLPAIVARLAAWPPFDLPHVTSLIEQESVRAIARLESAGAGPAPPPSGGTDGRTDREAPPPEDKTEPVALGGPNDPVSVWGKAKDPLPPAQYLVIKALVEARAKGKRLSADALRRATKDPEGNMVEDPVRALERLRDRDTDWKNVIDMAGTPGRGYGLRDKPPTPTQKNRETRPRRPRGGQS